MLVRAFRVTDRLGNALLRLGAWSAMLLVEQTALLKNGLFTIILTVGRTLVGFVTLISGTVIGTARRTTEVTQDAVDPRPFRFPDTSRNLPTAEVLVESLQLVQFFLVGYLAFSTVYLLQLNHFVHVSWDIKC